MKSFINKDHSSNKFTFQRNKQEIDNLFNFGIKDKSCLFDKKSFVKNDKNSFIFQRDSIRNSIKDNYKIFNFDQVKKPQEKNVQKENQEILNNETQYKFNTRVNESQTTFNFNKDQLNNNQNIDTTLKQNYSVKSLAISEVNNEKQNDQQEIPNKKLDIQQRLQNLQKTIQIDKQRNSIQIETIKKNEQIQLKNNSEIKTSKSHSISEKAGSTKVNSFLNRKNSQNFESQQKQQSQEYRYQKLQYTQNQLKQLKQQFKNNIFYISKVIKAFQNNDKKIFQDHFQITIQSLLYSSVLQAPKNNTPIVQQYKKTLVLDLDETLVHCVSQNELSQIIINAKSTNGEIFQAGINIRPYCRQFLKEMAQIYDIVIFTASSPGYANPVIDYLDKENKWIKQRFYRDSCIMTNEGYYIKDLRILGRNLKDVIIVDNFAYSFGYQVDNGIPILSYYDDECDDELKDLSNYLYAIKDFEDIREPNKCLFKLNNYAYYELPQQIIENIYQN